MTLERYPLTWPVGQPRTHRRRTAAFSVDFARARDEMLHSLTLLGARQPLLSSNVPLRRDGLPYAGMAEPDDPGVAVYFQRYVDGVLRPYVIACDTYTRVRWNIRAIGATIEALRSIQRHGSTTLLEQAFTGFASLPSGPAWWTVLGVPRTASLAEIETAFKNLAFQHHPDRGGSEAKMVEVNWARTEGVKERTS